MSARSDLELAGSPVEQGSAASLTWYWNPAAELAPGSTISAPMVLIFRYRTSSAPEPAANAGLDDVTASGILGRAPFIGTGDQANQVGVTLVALQAGYSYRVMMSCSASDGNAPERFFTVVCKL